MTDYRDPNRPGMDYRDPNNRLDIDRRSDMRSSNAMWGWIAGAVFLVLVLAVIFGLGGNDSRTAGTNTSPPAATTGSGGSPPAAPARPSSPAPAGQSR
jgi:hypothetical protein